MKHWQNRRSFLKTACGMAAVAPLMNPLPEVFTQLKCLRLKITDARQIKHSVRRKIPGELEPAWALGSTYKFAIGGGAIFELHTDQGIVGIGPPVREALLPAIRDYLIGKDPFDTELLYTGMMAAVKSPNGFQGADIALWDIVGKACGQPLYKLWGGVKDKVAPYASMIQLSTPEERADLAVRLKSEGWQAMKLRLHYPSMKEDIRLFETVRKAVGDDWVLMVDPNQGHRIQQGIDWDYKRAFETGRALQEMNCYWYEEPLKRNDLEGYARLARELEMPLAGAEDDSDLDKFATMMRMDAFDFLNPECLIIGIWGIRKVAAMAQLFNKKVVPHNGNFRLGTIAHLHLIASWSHAPYIEVLHDPPIGAYTHNFDIFTNQPLLDSEGFLKLPQEPGLGVDIDPDLIIRG
jgi:D-galactarolactone cycloisomerase